MRKGWESLLFFDRDTMAKRIIVSIVALLFAGTSFAGDHAVLHIRKECRAIQSALPRLKAESLELNDYSPEGGDGTAFRDSKGNIRFIRVSFYGETGKVIEEFCYENEVLIFALSQTHRYNTAIYITQEEAKKDGSEAFDSQKTAVTEDRYYFKNGKMIQWLNKKQLTVHAESEEFKAAEKKALKMAEQMLSKFKMKS